MNAISRTSVLKASLYLWMVVIPFSAALSNVFLVICSLLVTINLRYQTPKEAKTLLKYPAFILFFLFAFSIVVSEDNQQGFYELKHNIPLILSAFVVFFSIQIIPSGIIKSLIILIIATFIAFIFSSFFNLLPFETARNIHEVFGTKLKPFEESNRDLFGWYIPFMVRIQFGNLMSFLAIVAAVMAIIEKKPFWWISSILLTVMVFIIGVRGSMLGLMFAGFILLIYVLKEKISISISAKVMIGLMILLIPVIFYAYGKINARWQQTKFEIESVQNGTFEQYEYEHYSILTRWNSWKNGIQLWQQHPFTGTGIGDYKKEYQLTYQDDTIKVPLYYHSQWFYFLGVFGIVGLLIFIVTYILWWFKFRFHKTMFLYGSMLSLYLAIIWIFDAGMLSQIDIISFGFFTTLIQCFKEN
jgi:O-antigen ligase